MVTYTGLISACVNAGDMEGAKRLFSALEVCMLRKWHTYIRACIWVSCQCFFLGLFYLVVFFNWLSRHFAVDLDRTKPPNLPYGLLRLNFSAPFVGAEMLRFGAKNVAVRVRGAVDYWRHAHPPRSARVLRTSHTTTPAR